MSFKARDTIKTHTWHPERLRRPAVHLRCEVGMAVVRVRQQRQRDWLGGREFLQERRQEHVPALALLPLEHLQSR